ncbi:MAG TPA: hypothetical protein VG370_23720 [Chloroflexota bacterium]|nr:hypothetical protein [Chloroflexota bacterium]
MEARIGARRGDESLALACALLEIGRLPEPRLRDRLYGRLAGLCSWSLPEQRAAGLFCLRADVEALNDATERPVRLHELVELVALVRA